jgi:multiple sugar transport system substrate-binding protein
MIGTGFALGRRDLMRGGAGAALLVGLAPRLGFAQDRVTLTVWSPGGSVQFCDLHSQMIADFAATTSNVDPQEIQCGTGSQNDFIQTLLAAIAAGNPPDSTILWDTPVSLGARGALMALDEMMAGAKYAQAQNWPAGLLKTCQYGGKTYGLPITAGVYGMWYNQELFEAKGIPSDRDSFPKTWDEMRRLSKEFTVWNGDRLESAGFMPWRDPYPLPIWSALNGSQLYDAEGQRYTIDSEQNVEMMDFAVAWLDEEYKGDINAVDRSGSFKTAYASEDGLPPAFQEGRLAGIQAGSWLMGDIAADIEPVFTRWNVAPHPVGPSGTRTVSGSWPNWFVIPTGARHPAEAFAYLDYLSGEGVTKWYAAIPDLPTDALVPPTLPQVVVDKRGAEFAAEITAFFRQQADIVTPMWDSPVQGFAIDQLTRACESIMLKAATPRDALAEAQAASQAELEKFLKG